MYDGEVLEIKIGVGAFQDILAAGGSFVTNGYNATISTSYGSPIAGRQAWSGSTSGSFQTVTVNLPAAAAGQSVVFRWRVASDTSVATTGVFLDGVNVSNSASCIGSPITAPPEVGALVAANKTTFNWAAATFATGYDVVRGSTGAFPVGPGAPADETCFDNLSGPSLTDTSVPAAGTGLWYLSRGENACGNGTFGNQGNHGAPGAPRTTTTCP